MRWAQQRESSTVVTRLDCLPHGWRQALKGPDSGATLCGSAMSDKLHHHWSNIFQAQHGLERSQEKWCEPLAEVPPGTQEHMNFRSRS